MEFEVDKVSVGQVLSKYFAFPRKFSFHPMFHSHHHHHLHNVWLVQLAQYVAEVPSALSFTHPHTCKVQVLERKEEGNMETGQGS
jgi:hypothetical protein